MKPATPRAGSSRVPWRQPLWHCVQSPGTRLSPPPHGQHIVSPSLGEPCCWGVCGPKGNFLDWLQPSSSCSGSAGIAAGLPAALMLPWDSHPRTNTCSILGAQRTALCTLLLHCCSLVQHREVVGSPKQHPHLQTADCHWDVHHFMLQSK